MSVEIQTRVRQYSDGSELASFVDERIRANYTSVQVIDSFALGTTQTEIKTHLTSIEMCFIEVTGDAATVSFYKNRSPESLPFTGGLFVHGLSGVTVVALKASVATTIRLVLAGV